jgi:hypothetical protein
MLTFVSSVHNPKIMLGMLIKVLCGHAIATGRRLPREGSVTFEDLMRGASDLDVRSGTIEIVTSLRDLWPITVRIVTVITTMRSAVLSCSHETFCVDGKLDRYPNRVCGTPSQSGGVAPLFCETRVPSRRYARWGRPYFQQFFWCNAPQNPVSLSPVPCYKSRGIEDPVVAVIAEVCCAYALRAAI